MPTAFKRKLSTEGARVLKLLREEYGMPEDKALKLIVDGGAPLAVVLVQLAKRRYP